MKGSYVQNYRGKKKERERGGRKEEKKKKVSKKRRVMFFDYHAQTPVIDINGRYASTVAHTVVK